MSTTALHQRSAAREREIARRYAEPNEERIRVLVRDGFMRRDAEEIDRLERLENTLLDSACSVGLSEERRAELHTIQAQLDRFTTSARCHADRMRSQKQEKQQSEQKQAKAPPIEARRTSNVVTVCVDTEDRMKALLYLTMPAGFSPAHSVDQVAAYEWELVFDSITEASRFEQLAHDASRLASA